jgi:hypothetical protein
MATDQEMIDAVRRAFAAEPRPEHFANYQGLRGSGEIE